VLQEPQSRQQLVFWQFVDQGVEALPFPHNGFYLTEESR
jgi:hypothetical protein